MNELKPCPFCGSNAVYVKEDETGYYVVCMKCFAKSVHTNTKEFAAEFWNTRAEDNICERCKDCKHLEDCKNMNADMSRPCIFYEHK